MMMALGHTIKPPSMIIPNYDAPFEHRDRNRLTKIGEPKLNPTAAAEQEGE